MKKILLTLLLLLLIPFSAYATTTHYGYVTPTVGGSQNVWGTLLNTIFGQIDSNIWTASSGTVIALNAPAASGSNITLTNPVSSVQNIQFSAGSLKLILPAMNTTTSMVPGGVMYVNNTGSNAFAIVAQDGSTSVVSSLGAGQSITIQLLTNGTANGTFQVYGPYITSVGGSFLGSSASATSPSISGDATTGLYTAGAGKVDVAVSGSKIIEWSSTGGAITGGLNISGLTASQLVETDGSKNLVSATSLPNGVTATTQTGGDTSTKVATDAFVNTTALSLTTGTSAVTQTAGDATTKVATDAFVNGTALTLANGTTAVTQSTSDNSTKVATTAFVKSAALSTPLYNSGGSLQTAAHSVIGSGSSPGGSPNTVDITLSGSAVYSSSSSYTCLCSDTSNPNTCYVTYGSGSIFTLHPQNTISGTSNLGFSCIGN